MVAQKACPWRLVNVVQRHRENPRTFHIPTAKARATPGRYAKLIFTPADGSPGGERMWVEVQPQRRDDGAMIGRLANRPVIFDCLTEGEEIAFRPEHVADTRWKP